jgi:hypothetical protein
MSADTTAPAEVNADGLTADEVAAGWGPEVLTYGGASFDKSKIVSVWYDADRHGLVFGKEPASRVVGGRYEFLVQREDGDVKRRRGSGTYRGRDGDDEWVAGLEAGDAQARRRLGMDQAERRAKRDPKLRRLTELVENVAADMTYDQREGLVSILSRAVYRARRP